MFSKFVSVILFVGVFGLNSLATADDSCKAVFADLYTWSVKGNDGYTYRVETKVASAHAPDNNWVGYSTGSLDAIPIYHLMGGSFTSFLSDRLWYGDGGGGWLHDPIDGHPFDPDETDEMVLYLFPTNGSAQMVLKSWGDTQVALDPKCANGFMYAIEPGNFAMHIFTFKKIKEKEITPPKVRGNFGGHRGHPLKSLQAAV